MINFTKGGQKGISWIIGLVVLAAFVVIVVLVLPRGGQAPQIPADNRAADAGSAIENSAESDTSLKVPAPGQTGVEEKVVSTSGPDDDGVEEPQPLPETGKQVTVVYTDDGFSPANVTIRIRDSVLFVNQSSRDFWPASAVHPTHTVYPGSDIKECFSGGDTSQIFDACRSVAPGASYSFTFKQPGEWGYHNHLRASQRGKVIVE